jgi:D-methionine transport system ATP-binding protein
MPIVTLTGVTKTFPARAKGEKALRAINNVDLQIDAGDIYGIIGCRAPEASSSTATRSWG